MTIPKSLCDAVI